MNNISSALILLVCHLHYGAAFGYVYLPQEKLHKRQQYSLVNRLEMTVDESELTLNGSAKSKHLDIEMRAKAKCRKQRQDKLLIEWGASIQESAPNFPNTISQVAREAHDAITHALYQRCKMDPKIAFNAMNRLGPATYPPRIYKHNVSRLGIEIDHPHCLTTTEQCTARQALQKLSLHLAVHLSQSPWRVETQVYKEANTEHTEEFIPNRQSPKNRGRPRKNETSISVKPIISDLPQSTRPVALYFNTMEETLEATLEARKLRPLFGKHLDNISICCLGQEGIPKEIVNRQGSLENEASSFKRRRAMRQGSINPSRGMIVVVQPSEQNKVRVETPKASLASSLESLQVLSSQASMLEIPVVVISPRLRGSSTVGGVVSYSPAPYGNLDPPRPSPWLVADFMPPVYVWIGQALGNPRVAMTHSVMHDRHLWHIYTQCDSQDPLNYLASTASESGRPNRHVLRMLLTEWEDSQAKGNFLKEPQ